MTTDQRLGDRSTTKNRVVRVSDEVWTAARVKAKEQGERISDVIRRSLIEYADVKETDGLVGRRDRP